MALVLRCLADFWLHHPKHDCLVFLDMQKQLMRMWYTHEQKLPLLVVELEKQRVRTTAHPTDMGDL